MPLIVVNLTPHAISIFSAEGAEYVYAPSRTPVRVSTMPGKALPLDLPFPVTAAATLGPVVGLPEPEAGVIFVVSGMVATACKGRFDVFSHGELIRDEKGQPVGCRGLVQAPMV